MSAFWFGPAADLAPGIAAVVGTEDGAPLMKLEPATSTGFAAVMKNGSASEGE